MEFLPLKATRLHMYVHICLCSIKEVPSTPWVYALRKEDRDPARDFCEHVLTKLTSLENGEKYLKGFPGCIPLIK